MTILVVQSRFASTRLPGKALMPLGGKPVLAWVFAAMKKVPADRYFLATDYSSSEKLFPVAKENGFECFEGPEEDVLERFCMLIKETGADSVIRVTGDNPFLFYEAAAETLVRFSQLDCDYFTFSGLPHGSGVEMFKAASLLDAAAQTDLAYDHEHVGPAIYNHTNHFSVVFEKAPDEWYFPQLRTTIDTPRDYYRAVFMSRLLQSPASYIDIVAACKRTQQQILLVPAVEKGHGTGHLRRCIQIAMKIYADIYIPPEADLPGMTELLSGIDELQIVRQIPSSGVYSLVVADAFCLTKEKAALFAAAAPLAAIDEGSTYSDYCDYLLDIIPSCQYQRESNLRKSSFIPLPEKRRKHPKQIETVIVTAGGEDPAALTVPAAKVFASLGYTVTAVCADAEKQQPVKGVKFVNRIETLREKLYMYDLVVTHYGFTAFEAVAAGSAVLLLGTSALHTELAKNFGFAILEPDDLTPLVIKAQLQDISTLFPSSAEMLELANTEKTADLAGFLENLASGERIGCPVCDSMGNSTCRTNGDMPDSVICRFQNRTIRKCQNCGMLYLSWSLDKKKQYKESYFFDDYKKQYGKTYLEDFASIKALGVNRSSCLDEIFWKKAIKQSRKRSAVFPKVLDIGCAYGPFLSAAVDAGWAVYGTDISESAVKYVSETLKYPAVKASFPEFDAEQAFGIKKFDAVTMWFVIEHFPKLGAVLQRVSSLLSVNGIFAFSTPSASGVSAVFNERKFFEESPDDHYSLWQPELCVQILQRFGFRVVKIISTGQHPERFPFYRNHKVNSKGPIFKILSIYSKILGLGDTFEVYCIKEK